jgi:hypothetical protein
MGIAAQLIANEKYTGIGVQSPEFVFNPEIVFNELAKREIQIHVIEEIMKSFSLELNNN